MEEKSEQIETKEPQVSPVKTKHETKPSRYKNIVHLWEFLLEMLADEHCSSLISWSRQNYQEFKLKDKEEVARRWGILKGRRGMNYDKLSRALRYYYRQGIIKKVPGQRLVYRFSKLPYEYIPGVTRSSSLQGQRIPQTVRSQEQGSRDFNDDDNISAFSPTKTPLGRSWSWPVMPGPCQPINYLRSNVADIPPLCYTGSKLIFPIVRHSSLPPEWLGFRPVDRVSQFYKTCPFPRSIPVSVIKPTAQVNLPQWKTI